MQRSPDHCSTIDVAKRLGMAVRSVQMMVDRGELQAWRTPGGHRRILRESVDRWIESRQGHAGAADPATRALRVLLIEDSMHYQELVSALVRQTLPDAELHCAENGITGLALTGKLEPDVLIIDILLPGIDGGTLINSLRSAPQFARMQLVVVTSLSVTNRAPYARALASLPVVHKTRVVAELPALLRTCAERALARRGGPGALSTG